VGKQIYICIFFLNPEGDSSQSPENWHNGRLIIFTKVLNLCLQTCAFTSLQGYQLYSDGHVEELSYHSIEGENIVFLSLCQANENTKNLRWEESLLWLACDES